jgi:chromosomal replication initiation ATPase DnaA
MNKDLEKIINAVADATDLRPCQILCRRRFKETIDARWIAVYLLSEKGYYSTRIAEWMGMTTRNVNLILSSISLRLSTEKKLRSNLESAKKYLLA